jgi:hypothetical protein
MKMITMLGGVPTGDQLSRTSRDILSITVLGRLTANTIPLSKGLLSFPPVTFKEAACSYKHHNDNCNQNCA